MNAYEIQNTKSEVFFAYHKFTFATSFTFFGCLSELFFALFIAVNVENSKHSKFQECDKFSRNILILKAFQMLLKRHFKSQHF